MQRSRANRTWTSSPHARPAAAGRPDELTRTRARTSRRTGRSRLTRYPSASHVLARRRAERRAVDRGSAPLDADPARRPAPAAARPRPARRGARTSTRARANGGAAATAAQAPLPTAAGRRRRRAERDVKGVARERPRTNYMRTFSFSASNRFGPMPLICFRSSTEPKPPCCFRQSRIFCAVVGPMPSSVSSCSSVAVLRLTGPESRRRAGLAGRPRPRSAAHPARHDHLLPVGDLRGQVDRLQVGSARRPTRAPQRQVEPRPAGQPVDARVANRAGHIHLHARRRAVDAQRCGRTSRAAAGLGRRRLPQVARADQRDRDRPPATYTTSCCFDDRLHRAPTLCSERQRRALS